MNEEQRKKVELAKAKRTEKPQVLIFEAEELNKLYGRLDELLTITSGKLDITGKEMITAGEQIKAASRANLTELNDKLVRAMSALEKTAAILGEKRVEEVFVKNLPAPAKEVIYDDTKQINELIANRKAIGELNKGLGNIADQIADGLEGLKPSQKPDEFIPFRRVYKQGNRLAFDDDTWVSAGGGAGASSSSSGSGDGTIIDGVNAAIKATVFDYTSSNPLGVVLRDTNGDYVSVGGGTQYTEDAAAAADPVGTAVNLVRKDTPATITSTDGDNVTQRGTNYGAAYVQVLNSTGSYVDTFGGGTQYTEGDIDASITGTAMLWEDGSDTLRAVSAAKPLPIGDAGGSITVDGTFWQATQPVSGTVTVTQTTSSNLKAQIQGFTAHDAVDADFPIKVGGKANSSVPTNVTAGDRVDAYFDLAGRLKVDGSDVTQPVSLASVPSHAVTNAGTFAVQSTNQTGDNTIGRVKLTDGTDVADILDLTNSNPLTVAIVDTSGDQISSFGGGTQYTEDAAAAANPVGTALNLVRADALAGLTTTDGDNVAARGTDKGEQYVKHADSIAVTSATFATAAKQPALGTAGTSSADVITVQGRAAMTPLLVDGSATTQPVSAASLPLPTGASTSAKQPALGTAGTASTDVITIQGIASMTKLLVTPDANSAVNVAQINGVTPLMGAGNTGTGSARVTIATDQAAVAVTPGGNVAHDAADSGNPVKVGYKAETSPKGITLVADGDRTDGYADADGLQMVKLNTSNADIVSERVTNTDGASTAFTNFSAVASTRNYVTAITINNSSTTDGTVDFRDGAAGSVLWTMPAPAGGGSVIAAPTALFKTTANTALAFDVSGALSTVTISVSGFQSKA